MGIFEKGERRGGTGVLESSGVERRCDKLKGTGFCVRAPAERDRDVVDAVGMEDAESILGVGLLTIDSTGAQTNDVAKGSKRFALEEGAVEMLKVGVW